MNFFLDFGISNQYSVHCINWSPGSGRSIQHAFHHSDSGTGTETLEIVL